MASNLITLDQLETSLNRVKTEIDSISSGTAATVVIAASDSKDTSGADYICSSTSANTVIQTAINALASTGGKILFLEGTYSISSVLTCVQDIIFEGMGAGTIFNVSSASFIKYSSSCYSTVKNCYISASAISTGLFYCGVSNIKLNLEDLVIDITNGSGTGVVCCGIGSPRVNLSNVRIETLYLNNSSDCVNAFSSCLIKGGEGCYINLTVTNSSGEPAEIFYCCNGSFSGGSLFSSLYIIGMSDDMSILNSYVYCASVNSASEATTGLGRFIGNKLIIDGYCCLNYGIVANNQIKKLTTDYLSVNARVVTGNIIQNYRAGDMTFMTYSIVANNVSTYTMYSSTPTGTTITNNVVYSSLSVTTTEV